MREELFHEFRISRDPKRFGELVDSFRPLVYSMCRRYLKAEADLEDAVQSTFVKLAENAHSITGSVTGWLMSTAYATSAEMIRKSIRERRRRQVHGDLQRSREENQLLHGRIEQQLHDALLVLDSCSRNLIVERFYKKTPLRVIALETGISVATASRRVAAANYEF